MKQMLPWSRRRFVMQSAAAAAVSTLLPAHASAEEAKKYMYPADFGPMPQPAPAWFRNAVIAEVPTRGFNVSDYKNPKSWKSKYGDTAYKSITAKLDYLKDMGFNVVCLYSIYNCTPQTNLFALSYTEANPDMGTIDDAKAMIAAAHQRGMYVISNTNHYGVAKNSPLLDQHPDWFLPASFLFYSQRCFDFNVKAARDYVISTHVSWCTDVGLDGWRIDSAGHVFQKGMWSQILRLGKLKGKDIFIATENRPLPGYIQGAGMGGDPPVTDMQAKVGHAATAADPYKLGELSSHNVGEPSDKTNCKPFNVPGGGSEREGCFRVRGSQFAYGFNSLFAPFVPWMLVGETFNATHLEVPPSLPGAKMLHSYLDWTDAETNKQTVDDFRRLGAIRAANQDVFHNNIFETKLLNVSASSDPKCSAKPYVRFLAGKKAALVVGNNTVAAVTFKLQVPLEAMGFGPGEFLVTDCWTGAKSTVPAAGLAGYAVTVPADKSPGGGVRVVLVEAA